MKAFESFLNNSARCRDIYVKFKRNQITIIISLLVIMFCLIFLNYLSLNKDISLVKVHKYVFDNSDRVHSIISLIKDIIAILGMFLAGIWSYYVFIKGRTFRPKLNMRISLKSKTQNEIAIIKISIENTGKIKIKPLYARLEVYCSHVEDNDLGYLLLEEYSDILTSYLDEIGKNDLIIEPGVEMNIDLPILISKISSTLNKTISIVHTLLIKLTLVDNKYHVFKEISMLGL